MYGTLGLAFEWSVTGSIQSKHMKDGDREELLRGLATLATGSRVLVTHSEEGLAHTVGHVVGGLRARKMEDKIIVFVGER